MADRIVVLGAQPGPCADRSSRTACPGRATTARRSCCALVDQLHEIITGHELPDTAARRASRARRRIEPLPDADAAEIVGLLEYLRRARRQARTLFASPRDTDQRVRHVIDIVKAAEMLDFVDTPKRLVVLARPAGPLRQGDAPGAQGHLARAAPQAGALPQGQRGRWSSQPAHGAGPGARPGHSSS